jgi:predicted hydrocarbon binding protein
LAQLACGQTAEKKENQPGNAEKHPAIKELRWKQNWVKKVFTRMLETMGMTVDEPTRQKILTSMGRQCANLGGWPTKYKGNPEGFWNEVLTRWKETAEYDKENGIITVTSSERTDCTCIFVDKEKTPAYFCDCSLGWQSEMYETIFSKPVKVEPVESVLRGGKCCVFKIQILG